MKNPKLLVFDIESTNLSADMGYILCISYKWVGEKKVHTIAITDYPHFKDDVTNDRQVVKDFAKIIEEADAVIAHFGKFFDIPFIQTRLLINGLKPLPPVQLIDTWKIMKKKLKLHSNRLASGISAFDSSVQKTPLNGKMWTRASAGDRRAIKYVVQHCIADVKALENVYLKIRSVDNEHPNMALISEKPKSCPTCNTDYSLKKQGTRFTKTKINVRFKCNRCGSWFQAPLKKDGSLGRIR